MNETNEGADVAPVEDSEMDARVAAQQEQQHRSIYGHVSDRATAEERERNARFIERYAQRLEAGPAIREFSSPINRHRYEPGEAETFVVILNALASSVRSGIDCESDWPSHAAEAIGTGDPAEVQPITPDPLRAEYERYLNRAPDVSVEDLMEAGDRMVSIQWSDSGKDSLEVLQVRADSAERAAHQMSAIANQLNDDLMNARNKIGIYEVVVFVFVVLAGVLGLDWLFDVVPGFVS